MAYSKRNYATEENISDNGKHCWMSCRPGLVTYSQHIGLKFPLKNKCSVGASSLVLFVLSWFYLLVLLYLLTFLTMLVFILQILNFQVSFDPKVTVHTEVVKHYSECRDHSSIKCVLTKGVVSQLISVR